MEEYILEDNIIKYSLKRYYGMCSNCRSIVWIKGHEEDILCCKCKKRSACMHKMVYILIVEIFHNKKEIIIRVDYDHDALGNFSPFRDTILNLNQFAEEKSKIPWRSLSDKIRGYNIELNKVLVEDDYDISCKEWFESLECKFK